MQTKILKHYCSRALLGSMPVRTKNITVVTNMHEFEFNYSKRLLSIKNLEAKDTLSIHVHPQRFIYITHSNSESTTYYTRDSIAAFLNTCKLIMAEPKDEVVAFVRGGKLKSIANIDDDKRTNSLMSFTFSNNQVPSIIFSHNDWAGFFKFQADELIDNLRVLLAW